MANNGEKVILPVKNQYFCIFFGPCHWFLFILGFFTKIGLQKFFSQFVDSFLFRRRVDKNYLIPKIKQINTWEQPKDSKVKNLRVKYTFGDQYTGIRH